MAQLEKKNPTKIREAWTDVKPIAVRVRGSAEWKQWVEDLADTNRQSVSGLIDQALAFWAQRTGLCSRRGGKQTMTLPDQPPESHPRRPPYGEPARQRRRGSR